MFAKTCVLFLFFGGEYILKEQRGKHMNTSYFLSLSALTELDKLTQNHAQARRMLEFLVLHMDENNQCKITRHELSEKLTVSTRTLSAATSFLQQRGYIATKNNRGLTYLISDDILWRIPA